MTYNYVPVGLQLPVMVARVKAARGEADALLREAIPAVTGQSSRETGKALAKELLRLNRLLGVFDNAIAASEKLSARDAAARCSCRWKRTSGNGTAWHVVREDGFGRGRPQRGWIWRPAGCSFSDGN